MSRTNSWVWRLIHPRRTIWPTRDGVWCLCVVIGLGVAAVNTGNNLLYLLVSLLLALIIVSGVLSEQSMRGLELIAVDPEEIYAGHPAVFGYYQPYFNMGRPAYAQPTTGAGRSGTSGRRR